MFRRVLILAALVLGCGVSVSAQGFRIGDAQTVTSSLTSTSPITPLQATVAVCVNPANAVPCTNKASTFTSVTLVTGCSTAQQVVLAGTTTCVTQTDSRGNWGAWVAAGNYDITFTLSTGQSFGPYTISVGIPAGTSLGPFNCTSINAVPCVDTANHAGWAGTDACAWINSAQSAALGLNGASGVIDARGLNGTITCLGTFSVGSTTQGVSLLLGPNIRLVVQNTVNLAQASTIRGAANNTGSVGQQDTVIQAGNSFPTTGQYLVIVGPASGLADGVAITDIAIDCAGIALCSGMNIQNVQENSYFKGIDIIHTIGNGMDITGNSEDFSVENVQVIAGAAATTDNCFTLGTLANHIVYSTISCTSQAASSSTGAGFLCTGCAASITGFHVEKHTDGVLLAASGTFSSVIIGILNNAVANTNLLHIASGWFGSVRASGLHLGVGTNTVKNDMPVFNHVCTEVTVNKYDLGWTRTANAVNLDTDCGTLPSTRNNTLALAGTTAGNFSPDPTSLLDIRAPSATFNGIRMVDITSGNSVYFGLGAGTTGWGIRDQLNAKQLVTISPAATGATIVLPTACVTTTAQVAGSPPVLCAVTSQKNETAADANVLTFTPPAAAGTYHIRFMMAVSAANAATLGATLTYTNSNGVVQTPANLSIFQDGTAVPALTFTTSSAGDYFGDFNIDVNNSATAIVVKLTFSGTSFAAKVSATVERVI